MIGALKGILLAWLNMLVVAFGFVIYVRPPLSDAVLLCTSVVVCAGIPGVLTGAGLGALGELLRRYPVPVRLAVLIAPALGLVFGLAFTFAMQTYAAASCIPTILAAVMLERWTRVGAVTPKPETTGAG